MNARRLSVWMVVAVWIAMPAQAQPGRDSFDSRQEPGATEIPAAGFWPTGRMIDFAIDRITEQLAREYALDEHQLWLTRELFKERFPDWLQKNRAQLQTLINQYIEATIASEPPTPEEAADWARRALPLLREFTELVEQTGQDMSSYMTDEQRVLLEGQMAALRVGANYLKDRLTVWTQGGYDWVSEWPRSQAFQKMERQRQARLEQEAQAARYQAMGLEPPADVAPPSPEKAAPAPVPEPKANDPWVRYVEDFIKRYQLDEAQQNSARRLLREQQARRDQYLRRRQTAFDNLQQKLAAAKTDEERTRLRAQLDELNRPVERMFESLKERLDRLPTRKQRAAAAQADLVQAEKVPSAKTSSPGPEKAAPRAQPARPEDRLPDQQNRPG